MHPHHRLAVQCALVVAVAAVSACATEQGREEVAAREFHQRLAQNRVDLIYASSSDPLRAELSEAQFRKLVSQTQAYGVLQDTERAHYKRTQVPGSPDVVVAFYNSRYAKASCLEAFSWRMERDQLKLAAYSCAPNMVVTCSGGASSQCETSPTPRPSFAGD